jgi:hypothetical protein
MGMSEFFLSVSIFLPPVLWTVLIAPFLKKRRPRDSWLNVSLMLNPKHGLGSQTLFWLVVLVPLTYFAIFGAITWKDYSVSMDTLGFLKFIEISTLPIGLLSLSIPLTALVTYLHSTAQTAKQIEKNEHEMFYLHRREFVYYFEQIGQTTINDVYPVSYKISPRIHGKLFKGDVSAGIPELDRKKIDGLVLELREAEQCLAKVLTEDTFSEPGKAYLKFCEIITNHINFFIIRDLRLLVDHGSHPIHSDSKGTPILYSIGCNEEHAVAAYECVKIYLTNVLYFSGYQKGLDDLFNNPLNIWQMSLEGRAKTKIRMTIAKLTPNPPDDLFTEP